MTAAPQGLRTTGLTRLIRGAPVVEDVSLDIRPGEVLSLLGPSGSGKSTVLRCLSGVDRPDAGLVSVDGVILNAESIFVPPEKRPIGMMFQDFALFPHLTATQNVGFGLRLKGRARSEKISKLLERVHMSDLADRYPHELSGGEQQRVALARALAPKPRVILMDEPFSGLDDRLRDGIRDETLDILREEGTAVLMVTHEPEEAMRASDTIALMRAGRLVQVGAPSMVFTQPVDREAAAFFSDVNVLPGIVQSGAAVTSFGQVPAMNRADGAPVEVVIRPQHVQLSKTPDVNGYTGPVQAHVQRSRFLGSESLIELKLTHDGASVTVTVPYLNTPAQGETLYLGFPVEHCMVFDSTKSR